MKITCPYCGETRNVIFYTEMPEDFDKWCNKCKKNVFRLIASNRKTINIYNNLLNIENGIDLHDLPSDKCEVKEKKEDEKI